MTEVLVIGGGMAGAMAALSAKRSGAHVVVARVALGATALSSGAIDVAADPCAPAGDLRTQLISIDEAARRVARANRRHPYAVLGERLSRLSESLTFASQQLPELLPEPGERNVLLPTPLGTAKPTALAQHSQWRADLSALPENLAVVQLGVNPLWDAALIARGLEGVGASLGRALKVVTVKSEFFGWTEDASRHPYELAQRLDATEAVKEFADGLRSVMPSSVQALLLPPVFGRQVLDFCPRLSEFLHLPCMELLSASPSVPGIRLQEALDRALHRAGIEVVEEEARGDSESPDCFWLGSSGRIFADSVVLASGKFIGGGIERKERFRETVFGLPVFGRERLLADQYIGELTNPEMMGEQAAFRAGVRIDSHLRPLTIDGAPFSPKVYAAGSVIGGYDPAADKTGLGVAIFTGYLAGEQAAVKQ